VGAAAQQQGRLSGGAAPTARDYAHRLLHGLGQRLRLLPDEGAARHPALSWADSGLMALTGRADGPARMCPVPIAACADGALAALAALTRPGTFAGCHGARLLGERAAIAGYSRNGAIAPGGSCRLLETSHGRLALNLARLEDWDLLPAWLEADGVGTWDAVARVVRGRRVEELVERGREIGLAVAADVLPGVAPASWYSSAGEPSGATGRGPGRSAEETPPLVVDLSSLWAGPLCGQLLHRAGARVVKVESVARPDGARRGPRAFFDLLNAGKASVALDLTAAEARARLRALVESADIVIEASRPRALRQLGIDAEALARTKPERVWISITGHGRAPGREQWIAYGDDAGVAAGLSAVQRAATGEAAFVGDAVADPLTGLHAALLAWSAWRARRGGVYELSLAQVVAHCIAFAPATEGWSARAREWTGVLASAAQPVAPPRARAVRALARPLGADTAGILGRL
jgi:hypothetical protein